MLNVDTIRKPFNKVKLFLLSGTLLFASFLTNAADSIWYTPADPLNIESLYPPFIPDGYIENTSCVAPNYQVALLLTQVAEAALCNNPQTRESYATAKLQATQIGIAKSAYLPSVYDSVSGNTNWSNPEQLNRRNPYNNLNNSLIASYLLYDFGNRNAYLENARLLLEAASATQSSIVQNVLLKAIQAYFQVQANTAALNAASEAEHVSEESYKAAQARYIAGVSTPADKLQAQTVFAQNTLNRISAEGTLKSAYGLLANVMGLAANQTLTLAPANFEIPSQNIDSDIDKLIEQAILSRPDLIASESQLKAAQASVEIARTATKPTISVSLSNSLQDGSHLPVNNNTALGVSISIPLFDGYAPSYKIRSAEANADIREAIRNQLKLQISLDVWQAFQNLRTANESIRAASVLVSSAEESSRVSLGRYKAGVGNILDTLNAQSALASAHQQKIQAQLNRNVARASLAQSMGSLDNAMIQLLPLGIKEPPSLETRK